MLSIGSSLFRILIYLAEIVFAISHFSPKVFNLIKILQDTESRGQTIEWFGLQYEDSALPQDNCGLLQSENCNNFGLSFQDISSNGSHNDSFGGSDEITDLLLLITKDRNIKPPPEHPRPHA